MQQKHRFQDENKTTSDFYSEVWVVCPVCEKKATAKADYAIGTARLGCGSCSYNKELKITSRMPAHRFFNTKVWLKLWLSHPFKSDAFWAYNLQHLLYLEEYIAAKLREHKDREGFTLLEKLPKFYHEAKNREPLLKIIQKLKDTV